MQTWNTKHKDDKNTELEMQKEFGRRLANTERLIENDVELHIEPITIETKKKSYRNPQNITVNIPTNVEKLPVDITTGTQKKSLKRGRPKGSRTQKSLENTPLSTTMITTRQSSKGVGKNTLPTPLQPDSVTPFPNLDQVQSQSTNLIDGTTKLLSEQMHSLADVARQEENLFKTAQNVNAICTCAKNINALIRTKLDIFKAYKD